MRISSCPPLHFASSVLLTPTPTHPDLPHARRPLLLHGQQSPDRAHGLEYLPHHILKGLLYVAE